MMGATLRSDIIEVMMKFAKLEKLKRDDRIAILSPSFAAPGKWPHVYALGLARLKEVFNLEPVEYPATKKLGASGAERAQDLADAFRDKNIKAVIATLGGNDQVTYVKNLPAAPFVENPKPFFGFSDNTHFENFLWLHGIPSYYGGSLFTQFAMEGRMEDYTVEFLRHALFDAGEFELRPSETMNDIGFDWNDPSTLTHQRAYEKNDGWHWDGGPSHKAASGTTWGGCLESLDELLRHGAAIPTLADFEHIVLFTETSEEIPPAEYVKRVFRAFGERGILERVQGVIVGRPKAWEFDKQNSSEEKRAYRAAQREAILRTVRTYNGNVPVIQNFDIGHTNPQIALPYGRTLRIDAKARKVFAEF